MKDQFRANFIENAGRKVDLLTRRVFLSISFHSLEYFSLPFHSLELKFIHVVNNDTSMHAAHTCTVAFRYSVLIECRICSYLH